MEEIILVVWLDLPESFPPLRMEVVLVRYILINELDHTLFVYHNIKTGLDNTNPVFLNR